MATFDTMSDHTQKNPPLLSELISPIASFLPSEEIPSMCLVSRDWYAASHTKRLVNVHTLEKLRVLLQKWIKEGFCCHTIIFKNVSSTNIDKCIPYFNGLVDIRTTDCINMSKLPKSVTHVTFPDYFGDTRSEHSHGSLLGMSPHVTHLTFGDNFRGNLFVSCDALVEAREIGLFYLDSEGELTEDGIEAGCHWPLTGMSDSVTHVTFGNKFRGCLKGMSSSVTHVAFGGNFSGSIDGISPNVTHLSFGEDFNYTLQCNGSNVTHISFGKNFVGYFIQDKMSDSVTHVTFSDHFIQSFTGMSRNVTHLTFGPNPVNDNCCDFADIPTTLKYVCMPNIPNYVKAIRHRCPDVEITFIDSPHVYQDDVVAGYKQWETNHSCLVYARRLYAK
jgi:hypothetical protein